jgi:hypothetical protein
VPITAHNFLDVDGSGMLSPIDALLIINELNARSNVSGSTTSAPALAVAPATNLAPFNSATVNSAPANTGATGAQIGNGTTLDQVAFTVSTAAMQSTSLSATAAVQMPAAQAAVATTATGASTSSQTKSNSTLSSSSAATRDRQQAADAVLSDWDGDLLL